MTFKELLHPGAQASDYSKSLAFCLQHEGVEYENVSGDNGGPTRAGVTWRDWNAYCVHRGKTPLVKSTDLRNVPEAEFVGCVEDLYRLHYWIPCRGDDMPWPLNFSLFDYAVNAGVKQSVKDLQRVLGVTTDGVIGLQTLAAVKVYIGNHGVQQLVDGHLARRVAFYQKIATGHNAQFLRGWLNRVADLGTAAKPTTAPKPAPKPA